MVAGGNDAISSLDTGASTSSRPSPIISIFSYSVDSNTNKSVPVTSESPKYFKTRSGVGRGRGAGSVSKNKRRGKGVGRDHRGLGKGGSMGVATPASSSNGNAYVEREEGGGGSLWSRINTADPANDRMFREAIAYLKEQGLLDVMQMLQYYGPIERSPCHLFQGTGRVSEEHFKKDSLLHRAVDRLEASLQYVADYECGIQHCDHSLD